MKKTFWTGLFFLSVFQLGFIRVQTVDLAKIPDPERWINTPKSDLIKKTKTIKDPLVRAEIFEIAGQYLSCVMAAKSVSPKSIVIDRAQALELRCAQNGLDDGSINPSEALTIVSALDKVSKLTKQKDIDLLLSARLKAISQLVKKSQWKTLKPEITKAFLLEAQMTKSQRGQFYADVGDYMISERKWGDAYSYFLRAKDFDNDVAVDGRLKNILPLVPKALRDEFDKSRLKTALAPDVQSPVPSSDELDLFNQAQNDISKGDVGGAAEALVQLLRKFPVSVKSKWAQDKLSDLLGREVDRSRGPQGNSVFKNKIVKELGRLDPDRMSDWAKSLFDMQSYPEAALLYEKATEQSENSVKAVKYIYMAARSYQLGLDYSKAKNLYKNLSKFYSMSNEYIDGSIQWALININEKDYAEAITHLEMARSRRMTNQQDLISLFWLFRAYKQKNEIDLMKKAAADLVARFPLTYYGLIAGYELNQKLPVLSDDGAAGKKLKLSLSEAEWKAVERAQVLLQAGLYEDASDELAILGQRSLSIDEEVFLSRLYAKALNYPKTFGILSDLFDSDKSFQNKQIAKVLFPNEFWVHVSDDKKRSQLDPYLLLSVMRQESAFRPQAVSRSKALGLMQMIPPTAEEVKKQLGENIEIPKDMFDPAVNIRFCAFYLAQLIQKFDGDVPSAIAAYNAGPTRIGLFIKSQGGSLRDTWVDELPLSETSFYVKAILKNYIFYRMLYEGQTKLGVPPWISVKN